MGSGIEWTDETWNPTRGCTIVSPGCTNCYAMKMAARMERMGVPGYEGLTDGSKAGPIWTGEVRESPEHIIRKPYGWRKGRRIFVNSMSDLFHPDASEKARWAVVVAACKLPQHTFQVLTKRSEGMRDWFAKNCTDPPRNLWLGVSVEDRQRKDRIDDLRQTPAAVRFVSYEPALSHLGDVDLSGIHWLIAGCESGPHARETPATAMRHIRDACAAQGVAFFLKQDMRDGRLVSLPELDGVRHMAFPGS